MLHLEMFAFDSSNFNWHSSEIYAEAWIPKVHGRLENVHLMNVSRDLLRSFMLIATATGEPNMESVRLLISIELSEPAKFDDLPLFYLDYSALNAFMLARRLRGSWFCEPLLYLSINVTQESLPTVKPRWPVSIIAPKMTLPQTSIQF
jgi:hypothetical protein